MKERTIASFIFILSLLLGSRLPAQQKPAESQGPDVAVIVNRLNPIENISSAELRKLFSGEKQNWPNGAPVNLFVRAPEAHERDVLLLRVLHMTESEYKALWVKKVYSGEVQHEPLALFSNGMALEAIRAEKGGIALISIQDVHQGVKVLKVDGHLPGTPGYPLK
jgi:ABC-type phosphate transport system substrate-binding protein